MSRTIRPAPTTRRLLVWLAAIGLVASSCAGAAGAPEPPGDGSVGVAAARVEARRVAPPAAGVTFDSAVRPRRLVAPDAGAFNPGAVALDLSLVKAGFSNPVLVTHAGDGSGRLFVVEQTGRIWIIAGGVTLPTPFLDLRTAISVGGERGLLGLAFHPDYPRHPYFYVNFTDRNGNTAVSRFTVSSNPNVGNRSSGVRLMTIGQPYANHNGGNLAFGRDGYLYIGTGDGGGVGDPGNRAQSLNSLLGKMLRIDVNRRTGSRPYAVPASNPYVGRTGLDEIWSRGLRNPWRWSFDRSTGQLWIGDVGQGRYEEVDRSSPRNGYPAGRAVNYGWPVLEANTCYRPPSGCSRTGLQPPQAAYAHAVAGEDNCSVTGGYVYRGSAYPVLAGGYVFGDFCSGRIWVMSPTASAPVNETLVRDTGLLISSFGEDEAGELYVVDLNGSVYRITASVKA